MSRKEVDRLGVIRTVVEQRLGQDTAARQLGPSVRQIKRLVRRYRDQGASGLVSRHRGRRPNNAIPKAERSAVLALVRSHYPDFGPMRAGEKLAEHHGHRLSAETLRQWMIAAGLGQAKRRKRARIHPRRPRRAGRGE